MRERLVQDQPDSFESFMDFMAERRLPAEQLRELRGYLEKNGFRAAEANQIRAQVSEHDIQPDEMQDYLNAYAASVNDPKTPALQQFLGSRYQKEPQPSPDESDKATPAAA
jgi:hypothetical protein